MITQELKDLVAIEAANIREYATEEERNKLDFESLTPGDDQLCIYGQMTGNCFGRRADELLSACANPYSTWLSYYSTPDRGEYQEGQGADRNFSAIEFYIAQGWAKNENLINYLKGKTDKLEL